ncbi:hypothetical protein MKX01_005328 [Papaver californicum]|nr:hypothetical protein MKX01_005328 [Papaver californicum]
MKSMHRKYTTRRNKMFDGSLKVRTIEDAKKKSYKNVTQEDWDWLCDHLVTSESFKKRSAADTKAREAVPYNHRGGSKSHVVHKEAVCSFIFKNMTLFPLF